MHRRQLITGVPAIWLATSAPANAGNDRSIEDAIADLTKRLQEHHGGTWVCKRDEELLMVQKKA